MMMMTRRVIGTEFRRCIALKQVWHAFGSRGGGNSSRSMSSSASVSEAGLTIYGFRFSQPTRALLMLCEANGIGYDFEVVDALKGDNRKGSFRKAFPSGQVPVILDKNEGGEEFRLFETPAILAYLCESRLETSSSWYPQDVKARAEINAWMHWHHTHSRVATKMVLHPKLYPKLPGQEEKWVQGNKEIQRVLKHMDGILKERPFLTGNEATIADLLIVAEFDQHRSEVTGLLDFSPFPHVEKWLYSFDSFPWYGKVFDGLKAARQELNF